MATQLRRSVIILAYSIVIELITLLGLILPAMAYPERDFNGDGFADLVIAASYESLQGTPNAGAVHVLYGSPAGLTSIDSQFFTQDTPGLGNKSASYDLFGEEVNAGDFNGDGYSDLVIGTPNKDLDTTTDAGAVYVLYGSPAGITTTDCQFWTLNSPGILGQAAAGDWFGEELTTGDINHDGFDDLAIGICFKSIKGITHAGAVLVVYGSAAGLSAYNNQWFAQSNPGDYWFGEELQVGDFNSDGFYDLAIAASRRDLDTIVDAGAVHVLYGSPAGINTTGTSFWTQDSPGIQSIAQSNELLGAELGDGDFNGDGIDDLAIGAIRDNWGTITNSGALHVLLGSSTGITAVNNQFWNQAKILGKAQPNSRFGSSIEGSDFNGDGFSDVAIGAPLTDLYGTSDNGIAYVLYGSAKGLTTTNRQLWNQDSPGIEDQVESGDLFGWELSADDFNGDGFADLAIGVANEEIGGIIDAGAVHVLYGSPAGLTAIDSQFWTQDSPGIGDQAEEGDIFGIL